MKFCFEIKLEAVKRYLSGYTERQVTEHYGVNRTDLFVWVERYRLHGEEGLKRHSYTKPTKEMRLQIVSEHLIESVSLTELSAKHLIARSVISKWCKIAREQGYEYLDVFKTRGRPPKDDMGRPKKKKSEEMTELELLQLRVKELEAENALLKKVKALVEAREARLKEIGRKPSKN